MGLLRAGHCKVEMQLGIQLKDHLNLMDKLLSHEHQLGACHQRVSSMVCQDMAAM